MWYIDVRDRQGDLVWCGAYSDEAQALTVYEHCVERVRTTFKLGSVVLNHDGRVIEMHRGVMAEHSVEALH